MKKLLILLLLASTTCTAQLTDKDKHCVAGLVITNFVGSSTYYFTKKPWISTGIGVLAGVLAGVGKEVYDKKCGRVFDNADLMATTWGSVIGGITLRVGIDFTERKQNQNKQYRHKL